MSVKTYIGDALGKGTCAGVTRYNQLITGAASYSKFYNVKAEVDDTGYNLVGPINGEQFVITSIVLYANKNVGAGDATVVLYENSVGPTDTTETSVIITQEMLKQTTVVIPDLNLIVEEGRWVNIKTDDDDVFCNLAGYYVPVPQA